MALKMIGQSRYLLTLSISRIEILIVTITRPWRAATVENTTFHAWRAAKYKKVVVLRSILAILCRCLGVLLLQILLSTTNDPCLMRRYIYNPHGVSRYRVGDEASSRVAKAHARMTKRLHPSVPRSRRT